MLDTNKIYLGDAYELIKQLPDKSIDLIVTDPPYEFVSGGGGGCFGSKKKSYHGEYYKVAKNAQEPKYIVSDDKNKESIWNHKARSRSNIAHIYTGIDLEILNEFDRVLKKINIYIWCSKAQIPALLNHYVVEKNCIFDILTWHKVNPIPTVNNTYASDTEYCLVFREHGVGLYGTFESKRKWYVSGLNNADKELYLHPTIKPLNIIKNLIINSSKENEIVLDPFIGSGTTAVACKELGRQYIGFEIDKDYWQIAIDRLKGITQKDKKKGQLNLFQEE